VSQGSEIGVLLRAARERMGLGVIQVAERLHVDAVIIEALEAGNFAALGAPVYARGHLRSYAVLLGEPEGPLQERYAAMQESTVVPDLASMPRVETQPTNPANMRWPLILVTGAVLLALILWWALRAKPA
jgi:cytoskeleton protein RodZ